MTVVHPTPSASGSHRATAAAAPSPLLELRGVTACYGRIQVLQYLKSTALAESDPGAARDSTRARVNEGGRP